MFDADGITSGTIIYRYLKNFTNNVYQVFSERENGHSIEQQMNKIEPNTGLLIICDSSTNSVDACKKLAENGIQIVILDHHQKEKDNPYALIVNPQMDDSPNKELSGAGVAYKTIKVLDEVLNADYADDYLDLVAVGMCSDVMSMLEPENRALVHNGLTNIVNPGIESILKVNKVDKKKINTQTIGFTIGPMLNGAARLGNIGVAIELLACDDPAKCDKLAKEIKALNDERKKQEAAYYEQVKPLINPNDKVIIVISDVDKAYNGLVATKIANDYQRPAMVLVEDESKYVGSFRSYGDFNLKAFLETLPDTTFTAGHAQAGGFACSTTRLARVRKSINEKLADVEFETKLEYDLDVNADVVDGRLIKQIEQFNRITGKGIPAVKLLVHDVFIEGVEVIGKNKDTVKVSCGDLYLMKFRTNENFADQIELMESYDVVGMPNINEWYNFPKKEWIVSNQIFIDDIKKST